MTLNPSADLPYFKKAYAWRPLLAFFWLVAFTLLAFIPLSGNSLNAYPNNAFLPPFQELSNWLGTDQLGRDVLWYLVGGTRTAWWLTFPPLLGATIIGILIGTTSAHFAKKPYKLPLLTCLIAALAFIWLAYLVYLYFGWVVSNPRAWSSFRMLSLISILVLVLVLYGVKRLIIIKRAHSIFLPVDETLQRIMDFWTTFPKLLLLLLLSTLSTPSILNMGLWIMATYWVFAARLARNRSLAIRNEPFYEAAVAIGTPNHILLLRHLWPAMKGQLITNFCFNASGLLGIGSTLAFLGIGLPADVPSWGKMLSLSRYSLESWWLLIFPAGVLLISIFCLQTLGNHFSKPKY